MNFDVGLLNEFIPPEVPVPESSKATEMSPASADRRYFGNKTSVHTTGPSCNRVCGKSDRILNFFFTNVHEQKALNKGRSSLSSVYTFAE